MAILNSGGSVLSFTTSIAYQSAANWLSVTPSSGDDAINATLAVVANPAALQPGTYYATITVNAGEAGTSTLPVTFTVGPPGVTVQGIVNAASFQTSAIAPGSYVALFGLNLNGANVGVQFNNLAASVIYDSAGQINLIVPPTLTGTSAQVVVTVNGQASNSFTIALTPQSARNLYSGNPEFRQQREHGVESRHTRQLYTGLSHRPCDASVATGSVTVNIGGQTGVVPLFAGAQGTLQALDQVNVTVPASLALTGSSVPLAVCVTTTPGQPVCSNAVSLYVQ